MKGLIYTPTQAEIEGLRDEAKEIMDGAGPRLTSDEQERLRQISEKAVDVAYLNGHLPEDEVFDLVWAWVQTHGAERMPSMMDVAGGNTHEIARRVREQMLRAVEAGFSVSIGQAAGELERLAARFVNNVPVEDW